MSMDSYLSLQKQIDQMSRALNPPYVDAFRQMERSLEPFRRQHAAMIERMRADGFLARIQEIAEANQRLAAAFDRIKVGTHWSNDLTKVHASWLRSMRPIEEQISRLQASVKLSLSASSQMATIAERFRARVDFASLGQSLGIRHDLVADVEKRFREMASGYGELARFADPIERLTALPAFVMPSASREVLVSGHAVLELSPVEDVQPADGDADVISGVRDEVSGVVELLNSVNPALAVAYRGAREALSGPNADRKRHVLSSLREMWGHLLRLLAPDEKVLPWVSGKSADLLHEGKPTRRARVLYVCRGIDHGPLSEFVNADTGALVKLVELFNRVHELEPGMSDAQLSALLLRTDSWLTFIIQISQEGE